MEGYLNLFEEECDLIGDKVYRLLDGCPLTVLAQEKQSAVLRNKNGRWQLQGQNFTLDSVQGVSVRLQLTDNPYVESSQT